MECKMSEYRDTKRMLEAILTDFEFLAKTLIENALVPKSEKMSDEDHGDLLDLLVAKEKELQRGLEVAAEQEELNEQIKQTKALMDERDGEIRLLHRRLLTAEATLMESLFEARKKMEAVNAAKKKPVPTEDIIKYAYRISASNAVCAPEKWEAGDPRRPYPTEAEMKQGFLAKSDAPANGNAPKAPLTGDDTKSVASVDLTQGQSQLTPAQTPTQSNQFTWSKSGELQMGRGKNSASIPLDKRNHNQDEVEMMSTDSSSSSSSDSQ